MAILDYVAACVLVLVCLVLFSGCVSNVLYDRESDADVRGNLSDLQGQQAESNGTAESIAEQSSSIAEQSGEIADGINRLTDSATDGERIDKRFESVLDEIRGQKLGTPESADNTDSRDTKSTVEN